MPAQAQAIVGLDYENSILYGTVDTTLGGSHVQVVQNGTGVVFADNVAFDGTSGEFSVDLLNLPTGTNVLVKLKNSSGGDISATQFTLEDTSADFISEINAKMDSFAQAVGQDVSQLRGGIGARADLTTTVKTTIVAAINSLKSEKDAIALDLANNYLTEAETTAAIATAKQQAIDSVLSTLIGDSNIATETKNSLSELIAYFEGLDGDQQVLIDNLINSKVVRYDAQTLTAGEKTQARTNIGAVSLAEATTAAETAATAEVDARLGTGALDNYLAIYLAARTNSAI